MILIYFKNNESNAIWVKSILKFFYSLLLNRKRRKSSLEMVNDSLIRLLKDKNVRYRMISSLKGIEPNALIISLGLDYRIFGSYNLSNPVIGGIGLMTHPVDALDFLNRKYLKAYLQHSDWTVDIYRSYIGGKCLKWPTPIDINLWRSNETTPRNYDLLIYVKFIFKNDKTQFLLDGIINHLTKCNYTFNIIHYGNYNHSEYKFLLNQTRGMIFLCEHESQGLAYQEALSMDVPVLAWDQGFWLDPNYTNDSDAIHASSVPYFDCNCGEKFGGIEDFKNVCEVFMRNIDKYKPREYVVKNLSDEVSFGILKEIINGLDLGHHLEYN
jgi:hypothetical protein